MTRGKRKAVERIVAIDVTIRHENHFMESCMVSVDRTEKPVEKDILNGILLIGIQDHRGIFRAYDILYFKVIDGIKNFLAHSHHQKGIDGDFNIVETAVFNKPELFVQDRKFMDGHVCTDIPASISFVDAVTGVGVFNIIK